jgi:hypothetical protein
VFSEGITSIGGGGGYDIFGSLRNLKSISFPSTLTYIANAFNNSPALTTLTIPNKVKEIHISFSHSSEIETVIIGYSIQTISSSFVGTSCGSVTCFAVTPPDHPQSTFKGGILGDFYVPAESLSKYKDHFGWMGFDILPLTARPDTRIIASGTAGSGITWQLDSNGILTIKGTGAMDKWGKPASAPDGQRRLPAEDSSAPWYPYHSDIWYVVIESGVTSIGDNAFNGCTDIQSITCYAAEPPACGADVFGGIDTSIPLYVPEGAAAAYQNAGTWQDFLNVQATEAQLPTEMEEVSCQPSEVGCQKVLHNGQLYLMYEGRMYDVQGQEVR